MAAPPETVRIEAGHFPMGSKHGGHGSLERQFPLATGGQYFGDDERPLHYTFITKPFEIGKTEVTVAQFREFVDATGYVTEAGKTKRGIVAWSPSELAEGEKGDWREKRRDFQQRPEFSWKNPGFAQQDNHPVVGVSWNDAKAYCAWLSKTTGKTWRLPTEAEWEYAAKAGTGIAHFHWGNDVRNAIHEKANIGNVELEKTRHLAAQRHWLLDVEKEPADPFVFTAPVGSFPANAWGLHDVSGNVWEWCEDLYQFRFYKQWEKDNHKKNALIGVARDPVNRDQPENGSNEFRAMRGGSWYTGPLGSRSAVRGYYDAVDAACYIGFRVLRETDESSDVYEKYQAALKTIADAGGQLDSNWGGGQQWVSFKNDDIPVQALKAVALVPGLDDVRDVRSKNLTQAHIAALATIPSLRYLTFGGLKGMENVDLSPLGKLPSLDYLSFGRGVDLREAHFEQLAALTGLRTFLANGQQGQVTDSGLAKLASNRKLQKLNLDEDQLSGTCLAAFKGIDLRDFSATGKNGETMGAFTDESARTLFGGFPGLQRVALRGQPLTDAGLEGLSRLAKLNSLDLGDCKGLTDAGLAKAVAPLEELAYVGLGGVPVGIEFARITPRLYALTDLHVGGEQFDDACLERLSRCRALKNVTLDWRTTTATPAGVAQLWRNPNLERLRLEAPNLVGSDMEALAAAPKLRSLLIVGDNLNDDLIKVIAAIQPLKDIEVRNSRNAPEGWKEKLQAARPKLRITAR